MCPSIFLNLNFCTPNPFKPKNVENFHTLKYTINSFVGYDNIPFRCIVPHRLVFYSRSAGSWFRILNFNEIISANLFVGEGAIRQQSAKIPAYGTENVGESDIDWRGFASLNWICRETKRCAAREEPRAAFRLATYVRTYIRVSLRAFSVVCITLML